MSGWILRIDIISRLGLHVFDATARVYNTAVRGVQSG